MKSPKEKEEKELKNINGYPYNTKELVNWIMKHIIVGSHTSY
ncbi:MAG: hypothetical protein ACFE8B_08000 [Candidatus Hermodarchaeota archaeon]